MGGDLGTHCRPSPKQRGSKLANGPINLGPLYFEAHNCALSLPCFPLRTPERQRQSRSRSASSLPSPPAATRAPPPSLFSSRRRRRGWRPPTSSGPTRSMPGRSSTPLPSPTPWSTSAPSSLVIPPTLFSLRLCRCFCLVDHVPAATLRHLLTASPYAVAIIFSLLVLEH